MNIKTVVFLMGFLFTGCAALTYTTRDEAPPEISDFPDREVSYQVKGSVDTSRYAFIEFLSQSGWLHKQEVIDRNTYVVTTFMREPADPNDRRLRKTAYLVKLSPLPSRSDCCTVSLNWLVQSRGIREEKWSIEDTDVNFDPSRLKDIIAFFTERRCQ